MQSNHSASDGMTPYNRLPSNRVVPAHRAIDGMIRMAPRRLNPTVKSMPAHMQTAASPVQTAVPPMIRRLAPPAQPAQPRVSRSAVLNRQGVKAPARLVWKQPSDVAAERRRRVRVVLSSMAFLIFMVGLWVSFNTWRLNHSAKSEVSALAAQESPAADSDPAPAEAPPAGSLGDYHVAPAAPRILTVPRFRVTARVQEVTMSAASHLKAPDSVYDAGWYGRSAKPGEAGAVLINGYIQGPTRAGAFYNFKKLLPGDKIELEKGDGSKTVYTVVKLQSFLKSELDKSTLLNPLAPYKKGLNILTYDGKSTAGQSSVYDRQQVVFAAQTD